MLRLGVLNVHFINESFEIWCVYGIVIPEQIENYLY